MWKSMIVAILIGGSWLLNSPAASSQNLRTLDATRPQSRGPFSAANYSTPPVSPYLNLGVTANGVSNYQTLVRPMIEDREVAARQAVAIEQLNRRVGGMARVQDRRELPVSARGTQPPSGVRFMHYSHYFGTMQ